MAQTIKLRRSSTEGKVPTTSQLALGEIAINTYDGRVFFEKNDGSATIQHIVTTDSITTGSVSIVGQLTVDDITINGSTISDGGDLTLDANGDIILDANGADIRLEDNGTAFGRFKRSSSDLIIKSDSNNNDIIFKGVDNSATITALTLDMSDAGTAIFENNIKLSGSITFEGFDPTVQQSSTTEVLVVSGSGLVGVRSLGSNAFNSTSFLTAHPNISAASSVDNSNGSVIQDVTLDSNGHVTALASANLDGRYYTETESDTLFTKKLGQGVVSGSSQLTSSFEQVGNGIVSGAAQIAAFGDLEIANPTVTGTLVSEDVIQFTGLSSTTETTAVMIDSSNELSKRTLGSNAFTSTTITPDGGNADTVDSLHASSFLRSDAVDSAGSKITFSGGLNIPDSTNLEVGTGADFVINDNGASTFIQSKRHAGEVYFQCENTSGTAQNVIILGTDTSNTSKTYVELRYNNVERIRTTSDGSRLAGVVNFDGTTQSTSKTTGALVIDGGVGIAKTLNVGEDVVAYASSDERYKDLITPIENPNEKIKLLSGNTFVWNDKHEVFKGKKDIGVIAQEVEKVLPEIVETRENGYKAVKYEKIVALLIESNKELIKRVEELEEKLK